jgi:phosphonopyruvate decarboxylase
VIPAAAILDALDARGFDSFVGVPCSFLTAFIDQVIHRGGSRYVAATSEGEAVAIAAGAWLAGRRPMVLCQNSGLGNMVNPITSLLHPFRIPLLLGITWRGEPGLKDEPQHELMGEITHGLLSLMRVPFRAFPTREDGIAPALDAAEAALAEGRSFALVIAQGSVAEAPVPPPAAAPSHPRAIHADFSRGGERPSRHAALEALLPLLPEAAAVVATTGKCGRELFTLADRPQHLYLVGSMGGASALGLGVALNTARPVVVLDGDGAALMKLGNLATVGARRPENLLHLVLDNGVHESTGGQATVSSTVDFAAVAAACGYARTWTVDDAAGLAAAARAALASTGPHLVHARIRPGSLARLGRPTIPPADVARRFRAFVTGPI